MNINNPGILNFNKILLTSKVFDLGIINNKLLNIYSPIYEEDEVNEHIHQQFREGAGHYISKYTSPQYWKSLLSKAINNIRVDNQQDLCILDIGSGAGNTIFPLIELFPNATIIATDLSLPLLKHLNDYKILHYPDSHCYILQLNAEKMIFKPKQFDIVIGGAILHHLFNPQLTLKETYKVLKPNGYAIFFEPFENGNKIITLTMKQLKHLNKHEKIKIPKSVINFFDKLIHDFTVRQGDDKTNPIYKIIDDKWLFTKTYFANLCHDDLYSSAEIYPLINTKNMFKEQFETYLRLGIDFDFNKLPGWTKNIILELDLHFSEQSKTDLLIEGTIILKKGQVNNN